MSAENEDEAVPDIQSLVEHVMRTIYKARENDGKNEQILNHCLQLFGKDYKFTVVQNTGGELCSHYPSKIVLLEYSVSEHGQSKDNVESLYNDSEIKDLFNKARFARCRARFAVPVILFEGKHICRSATLSGGAEIYGRSGFDFFMTGGGSIPDGQGNPGQTCPNHPNNDPFNNHSSSRRSPPSSSGCSSPSSSAGGSSSSEWQLFNRIRGQDIRLLKAFSIGYICDLMVEKKKVKFGMNVTSSEKVDKEHRYADFRIVSVPYPGCEFFREWKDSGYRAEVMNFDWSQGYVDATLDLPRYPSPPRHIDWFKYKNWDLIRLTQNYLQLLLHYVREGDSGILVHCISGWDRTPLFVSLLRLSLWADGSIHQSLTAAEVLYLTIAYDWFLFGHNLPDRANKGEEIFFFCFYFLKYMTSDEFGIIRRKHKRSAETRNDSDSNMDGVLLDPELSRASYRGSNASLSSSSSLNSTKSSVDNAPIYFSAGSVEDDSYMVNGLHSSSVMMGSSNAQRVSPVNRIAPDHPFRGGVSTNHNSTTSPMAVPSAVRRNFSDLKNNSPNCGSWQIVSGSGVFTGNGSSSSHSSYNSHSTPTTDNGSCSSCGTDQDETTRKQRLDKVRRTFMTIFTTILGNQPNLEGAGGVGGGGGLTGLLGNFAEKVGFKSTRATYV